MTARSAVPSRLFLAPMEGLADFVLRDVLTVIGGYDGVVSEFIRVTGSLLPMRTYRRYCPEIDHGARTPAGTPMVVQLLGSDPAWLGANAERVSAFSPHGIDLNFGCPAKLVNRHGGGAMLLAEPERMYDIVRTVRRHVPASIPVTAKMRLGIDDPSLALAAAQALVEGGAAQLVVHGRTKAQGYRPPAHWDWIARIAEAVAVPVVANGDVWSIDDWQRCRAETGCADVMIGRGAVSDPFLAQRIRSQWPACPSDDEWPALLAVLHAYWEKLPTRVLPCHAPGRLKLILAYWRRTWPMADQVYRQLRTLNAPEAISAALTALTVEAMKNGQTVPTFDRAFLGGVKT